MALGYSQFGEIVLAGVSYSVACTGASMPYIQTFIESNAGYNGGIETAGTLLTGNPKSDDFAIFSSSIDFEIRDGDLELIKNILIQRMNATTMQIKLHEGSDLRAHYTDVFWTSLSITGSPDSLTVSMSFEALGGYFPTNAFGYIGNKLGNPLGGSIPDLDTLEDLVSPQLVTVDYESALMEAYSWSFDLTQEITFDFGCLGSSTAQSPVNTIIGLVGCEMSVEYIPLTDTHTIPKKDVTDVLLSVGSDTIEFKRLSLLEMSPNGSGSPDSLVSTSLRYYVTELNLTT